MPGNPNTHRGSSCPPTKVKTLGDTQRALFALENLEAAINTYYNGLNKLITKVDAAREERRQLWHCCRCGDMICKKAEACLEQEENFIQRIVNEGGPLCAINIKETWKQPNSSLSAGGSSVVHNPKCDSTYEHDYQHITNHHRELLKSLERDLADIKEWHRKVKYSKLYRYARIFKSDRGRTTQHIISSFVNFEELNRDYEWIWRSDWNVQNLEDMGIACAGVSLQCVRIDTANEVLLYQSAIVRYNSQRVDLSIN